MLVPLHAGLRPGDEHHAPGHHKHEDGADGRGQVGIDALDADLAEDRCDQQKQTELTRSKRWWLCNQH